MGQEFETKSDSSQEKEKERNLAWFRGAFPHFFTAKVVKNREKAETVSLPQHSPKSRWKPVTRKLGTGRKTHVALHMKVDDHSFYFKCPCRDVELPVKQEILQVAVAVVHGSGWVRIMVGTEVLRLNREELRAAYHALTM